MKRPLRTTNVGGVLESGVWGEAVFQSTVAWPAWVDRNGLHAALCGRIGRAVSLTQLRCAYANAGWVCYVTL